MNHLNSEQVEILKEIGAHLRQRRQELSIPIEEVAAKTLIRLPMLKAIDEGQSDQLPEPVFIQGFIRRYGDFVGLDGTALAKTFPTIILPVESDTSSQDLPLPTPQRLPTLQSFRSIPLYIPFILVLVAASGLLYLLSRPRTSEPIVQSKSSSVAQQQKTAATVRSAPAKPKASQSSLPIQVSVNLKEQSWMRVIVDGKTQFEGVLPKGKQQTWKAKKQLTLRAGNGGAVSVVFNQGKPKILGTPGNVKEVTFTPGKTTL